MKYHKPTKEKFSSTINAFITKAIGIGKEEKAATTTTFMCNVLIRFGIGLESFGVSKLVYIWGIADGIIKGLRGIGAQARENFGGLRLRIRIY